MSCYLRIFAQRCSALRLRLAVVAVTATALSNGCSPPAAYDRNAGPGGREQPLALSPAEELAVGRKAYGEVMSEVRDRVLPASSPEVIRVRRVSQRLVAAAEIEPGAMIGLGLTAMGIGTRYEREWTHTEAGGTGNPYLVHLSQMDRPLTFILVFLTSGAVVGLAITFIGLAYHHQRRYPVVPGSSHDPPTPHFRPAKYCPSVVASFALSLSSP